MMALSIGPRPAGAEDIIVLETQTFTRSTGAPFTDIRSFQATAGPGVVEIINGGGDGSDASKRSSNSRIVLNGEEIVSSGDLGIHTVALNINVLLLEGTNTLEVTMLGKPETQIDVKVTTRNNQAPIADFTAVPQSGNAPLDVSFDASASSDPDEIFGDHIVRYDWDFGDGNTLADGGPAPSHIYTVKGNFYAQLTVTDSFGLSHSSTVEISVQKPNSNPVALFTASPQMGDAPLKVSFDASTSSDPDEEFGDSIVRYDWDFGDGSSRANGGPTQSHLYAKEGFFIAELTVTDSFGLTDTTSLFITVTSETVEPLPDTVAEEPSLEAPNSIEISDTARIAITPYVQVVPNDSYTFMAFSHPSLDSAATQIGLVVEVFDMVTTPNNTSGASVHFTIDAGETHRVFIVDKAHPIINDVSPLFSDASTHLILTQNGAQFGNARITGINENPMQLDSNNNLDNLGQISMWGIIFMASTGTGFPMEFVGDAHDSTIPFNIAGENLKARAGSHTGAGRGIN